jgi:hypothetical protein
MPASPSEYRTHTCYVSIHTYTHPLARTHMHRFLLPPKHADHHTGLRIRIFRSALSLRQRTQKSSPPKRRRYHRVRREVRTRTGSPRCGRKCISSSVDKCDSGSEHCKCVPEFSQTTAGKNGHEDEGGTP